MKHYKIKNKKEKNMNTKYNQLKQLIKEKSEFQRILKNHRKTERFEGERLKNIKLSLKEHTWDKESGHYIWVDKVVELDILDNEAAARILDGNWESRYGLGTTKELRKLYAIYGILRNERKTKKIQYWENLVNDKHYKNSDLKKEVDSWRDEETICVGE